MILRVLTLAALLSCAMLPTGCAAPPFDAQAVVHEWAQYLNQEHVLVPGDVVTVTVYQHEDLAQELTIPPEGFVNLQRVQSPVRAVGRTVSEFRRDVKAAYANLLTPPPEVSVNLSTITLKSVYVAGEVRTPGVQPWTEQLTAAKAIAAAGGFLITAKSSDVRIVRAEPGTGAPRSFRVDVEAILYGESPDFPLVPGDVIWAQTSTAGDVAYFMELYLGRVLPLGIAGGALGAAAYFR